MRIAVFSEKRSEIEKVGWYRGGFDIDYYKNGLFRITKEKKHYAHKSINTCHFFIKQNFGCHFLYNSQSTMYQRTLFVTYDAKMI